MFLALREMRRGLVRFGLLAVAIALLMFLILFQQALQDGLITAFIGAIRNQSAPVLVYSVDGQRTLQASVITPELETAISAVEGVGATARIAQGTFTVRVNGGEESDATIIGTDDATLGRPVELAEGRQADAPGEAVGSQPDLAVGDQVTIVTSGAAAPVSLSVVGVARDVELSVTPTLFTDLATYEACVRAVNPDAGAVPPNAILVRPSAGVTAEEVAAAINASVPDAEALTRADAAQRTPGVAQVRQSFQVIFLLYGLVVPLVTGLFFLIVTLQKAGTLTLLRAVGARAGTLASALMVQVVLVTVVGLALGVAIYTPVSQAQVGGLSLRFDTRAVVVWSGLFLALALLSALVSLRRVLHIDPIEATTGAGVR